MESFSYVTREELAGKSPGQIITLFINRKNGTDFAPNQLDFMEAKETELEDGRIIIEVQVQPRRGTGWTNGPLTVKIPQVDVGDFYSGLTLEVDYYDIVDDKEKPAAFIRAAGGPPATPKNIQLKDVGLGEPNQFLRVEYTLTYDNVFFVGELPMKIKRAPNSLNSLKELNKRLVSTNDIT